MSTPQSGVKPRNRPPSLLACVTCRFKHLKCDAQMPVCGRCLDRQLTCTYIESKRGYNKGPRNLRAPDIDTPSTSLETNTDHGIEDSYQLDLHLGAAQHGGQVGAEPPQDSLMPPTVTGATNSPYLRAGSEASYSSRSRNGGSVTSFSTHGTTASFQKSTPDQGSDSLLDSFYYHFHSSHPFVIPRAQHMHDPSILPEYVKAVLRFVGSHFVPGYPQDTLRQVASVITSEAIPNNGFKVQGMLLFTMALFARFEQAQAAHVLNQTLTLALAIGMNRREFSMRQSMGNSIIEESWRRTWWDLYVVNGLVSAISGSIDMFTLQSVTTDVPLPSEEVDYMHCRPLRDPRSLSDMQNRAFDEEEYPWSSFAYRVEAIRIMGTVLQLPSDSVASNAHQVETIDASLSNFTLSLPPHKRELIEYEGKIDEVLFCAHMVINWAGIMLHRPRSLLTVVQNHYQTACTAVEESIRLPVMPYGNHTSKTLRAANLLSSLTAIQTPMTMHTPCYTCAIALGAIAHLPAYVLETQVEASNAIKERLQLAINALNAIGEVWPMAKMVKMQISQFARELFMASQSAVAAIAVQASPTTRVHVPQRQIDFSDDSWLDELYLVMPTIGATEVEDSQASLA